MLRLVIVAISIVVTGMALFGVLYGFAGLELWRRPIGEPRTPFLACLFLLLVVLRIPEHRDHRFRPKVITDSGIPITHSGDRDH